MEQLNISELRKERRPLWMTNLGHESIADMLGGGGDLWSDRLHPEWMRGFGEELKEGLA
jgi:hypothetical protein